MQINPEQGQFMALIVQLMGARRALEVGVFTGYSSLAVALALPADGRLVACDISEEFTSMARRFWKEAEVDEKIDSSDRSALETLRAMLSHRGRRDRSISRSSTRIRLTLPSITSALWSCCVRAG